MTGDPGITTLTRGDGCSQLFALGERFRRREPTLQSHRCFNRTEVPKARSGSDQTLCTRGRKTFPFPPTSTPSVHVIAHEAVAHHPVSDAWVVPALLDQVALRLEETGEELRLQAEVERQNEVHPAPDFFAWLNLVSGADCAGGKFGSAEYTLSVGLSMGEKL